jgi:signal transduction histidine kinase
MRLNYRFTISFAVITFFVLTIGFTIVYVAITRSTKQATIAKLEKLNKYVASQLKEGADMATLPVKNRVTVAPLAAGTIIPENPFVSEQDTFVAELHDEIHVVKVSSTCQIKGREYSITSSMYMVRSENIYLHSVFMVFAWTYIFLLSLVIILSEVFSWKILAPFNQTLDAIQKFQLHKNDHIVLKETQTLEFRQLNDFLIKMTARAKNDFTALKEFSENASHELQTPIATIKAKIELMMESDMTEAQAATMAYMHDELEKLSRINHSLTLLAKLEHYEASLTASIPLKVALEETLSSFSDWIEMKGLELRTTFREDVFSPIDATLAQLLFNNLVSNAIRHNIPGGNISIVLSTKELIIRNTGNAPAVPTGELFGRFRKGNSSLNSIGIGLAIVKKICMLYNWDIDYQFIAGEHIITLAFPEDNVPGL